MQKLNFNYIKGGVRLKSRWIESQNADGTITYDYNGAFIYYIQNCDKVKILTDDSISCVTYMFYLKDGVESPYVSVRSNNVDEPVKILLIKIGVVSKTSTVEYVSFKRGLTDKFGPNRRHLDH